MSYTGSYSVGAWKIVFISFIKYMSSIPVQGVSANYDTDQDKVANCKLIELSINKVEQTIGFTVDIGDADHFATYTCDLDDFEHGLAKAKRESDEEPVEPAQK